MTLFDEIAWLVREDEMDCHGQAWDVKKGGACPAAAFVSDSSVYAAGEFTGENCPKWLSFVQSCGELCEPSPEDISELCEEWRTNTKCYQSTEEYPEAFEGFQSACGQGRGTPSGGSCKMVPGSRRSICF